MTDIRDFDKEFGYTKSGIADIKKISRLYVKSGRRAANTTAVKKAIREEENKRNPEGQPGNAV